MVSPLSQAEGRQLEHLQNEMKRSPTPLATDDIKTLAGLLQRDLISNQRRGPEVGHYTSRDLDIGDSELREPRPRPRPAHGTAEHFDLGFQKEVFRFIKSDARIEQSMEALLPWVDIPDVDIKFYHFQVYGAVNLLVREQDDRRGAILADDMGLGKTLTALLYVNLSVLLAQNLRHVKNHPQSHLRPSGKGYRQPRDARCPTWADHPIDCACQDSSLAARWDLQARTGATLIFAPASLLGTWCQEFDKSGIKKLRMYVQHHEYEAKALTKENVGRLHLRRTAGRAGPPRINASAENDIILTTVESYERWVLTYMGNSHMVDVRKGERLDPGAAARMSDGLAWARIIRDEAHLNLNLNTHFYQIVDSIADNPGHAPTFIALTGTPMLRNGVADMLPLIRTIGRVSSAIKRSRSPVAGMSTEAFDRLNSAYHNNPDTPWVQDDTRRLLKDNCIRRRTDSVQNGKQLANVPLLLSYDIRCPNPVQQMHYHKVAPMLKRKLTTDLTENLMKRVKRGEAQATYVPTNVEILDNVRANRIIATVPAFASFDKTQVLTWDNIAHTDRNWHENLTQSDFYHQFDLMISSSAKLQKLRELVLLWEGCVAADGQPEGLVIVSAFPIICHTVICLLHQWGVSAKWIHADFNPTQKQELVNQFQHPTGSPDDFRVIVGTSAILGQGVTLTRAHRLVLMEPDKSDAVEAQIADRVHRLSSVTDRCYFYRLLNPDSATEMDIVEDHERQRAWSSTVEWVQEPSGDGDAEMMEA